MTAKSNSAWWREGESADARVFRQSALQPLLASAAGASLSFYFGLSRPVVLCALWLFIAVDCLLCMRRAIIVTDTHLTYRPPFGHLITLPFDEIQGFKEVATIAGTAFIGGSVAGLRLITRTTTEVFPLTVRGREQLMELLRLRISKSS